MFVPAALCLLRLFVADSIPVSSSSKGGDAVRIVKNFLLTLVDLSAQLFIVRPA